MAWANASGRCCPVDRASGACLGDWAVNRKRFDQKIAKFQGVTLPLADMEVDVRLANLILMPTAWKLELGTMVDADAATANQFCSEALGHMADQAIQIADGRGLKSGLPLERLWRDARIERIWDGTSEIRHHIISRAMLRPLGGCMSRDLSRLLRPKSIAVLGGAWVGTIDTRCRRLEFEGSIYRIHPPREGDVWHRLSDLPKPLYAIFVGVNREAAVGVLAEVKRISAGGAV
ncbi:acyl-CoA dehydrogenase family protein [Roseobacter sp.]|uniref:acyl-CoA dehydrogenase family protein n=1 Tax=Roseobacter sp. TaxID=1907202 RepID=UPI00385B359A